MRKLAHGELVHAVKKLEAVVPSESGVTIVHIQSGKPMRNGYAERFNWTCRRAVLDALLFRNL